jgi:hypothetical protein
VARLAEALISSLDEDTEIVTGVGPSIEDCLYKARWGMKEHVELLEEQGLPVPPRAVRPTVLIQNEEQAA